MNKLLALMLVVLSVVGCGTPAPRHAVKDAAVRLDFSDGVCSGTIVGRHTVLTATHCFEGFDGKLSISGRAVTVKDKADDGWDHTLIVVDASFDYWASHGAEPRQQENVFVFGNPGGHADWYRRGYVVGTDADNDGRPVTIYDLNGFYGDSGSGVFADDGSVVGVISLVAFQSRFGVPLKMMASYALHFTPEQWAKAGA